MRFFLFAFFTVVVQAAVARADVVTLADLEAHALAASTSVQARDARAAASVARVESARVESRPGVFADVGMTVGPGSRLVPVYSATDVRQAVDRDPATNKPITDGTTVYSVAGQPSGFQPDAWRPQARGSARVRYEGTLYDFGRTSARVAAARATAEADAADARGERESLLRGVRGAYLVWYGAYAKRVLFDGALESARARLHAMEHAAAAGARSTADTDVAAFEVARLELERARALALEADARRSLEATAFAELPADATPDETILETEPPSGMGPTPNAVSALALRADAALASGAAHRLRFRPVLTTSLQLGAFMQFAKVEPGQSIPVFPSYSISATLTVPLYDPRSSRAVESEARARALEMSSLSQSLLVTMDAARRRAVERYEAAASEVEMAARLVDLAARAAEGAETRWRTAGGLLQSVLDARERERRAREELLRSKLDRTEAALRLMPVE